MLRTLLILFLFFPSESGASVNWPSLSRPAASVGGGSSDAAVIVAIEGYAFVPPVPGAEKNAVAWYDYLTETRKVPPENVILLRGDEGAVEDMKEAAAKAAKLAGKSGTLWFIFIGHGAPHKSGKDGLLIGVDAQQKASSLQRRSLRRSKLLSLLGKTKAKSIHVVIDACFSGRSPSGAPLAPGIQPLVTTSFAKAADPRFIVLTAAKGNQFAGPLPGVSRPAFSYLILGALRGWGDKNKDGKVTAGEALNYSERALRATMRGRNQTPTLMGDAGTTLGRSARETAPSLSTLAKRKARPRRKSGGFKVSKLPTVPSASMPKAFQRSIGGSWQDMDVDALEAYDGAIKFDKSKASSSKKAAKWRALMKAHPKYSKEAGNRSREWSRYAKQQAAAARALRKRNAARDKDWKKLKRLLALDVVSAENKGEMALTFIEAYGRSQKDNPYYKQLSKYSSALETIIAARAKIFKDKLLHEIGRRNFELMKVGNKDQRGIAARYGTYKNYSIKNKFINESAAADYLAKGLNAGVDGKADLLFTDRGFHISYTTKDNKVEFSLPADIDKHPDKKEIYARGVKKIVDLIINDHYPRSVEEFDKKLKFELYRRHFNLLLAEKNKKATRYGDHIAYAKAHPEIPPSLARYRLNKAGGQLEYKAGGREVHFRAKGKSVIVTLPEGIMDRADKEEIYARGVKKIADLILEDLKPLYLSAGQKLPTFANPN